MSDRADLPPASVTPAAPVPPPRFTTGPILNHILVMTSTGALGLVAIFFGDLANIFFLSQLGDHEIVAAVGYASALLFILTSIGIGLSIGTTVLVAPALGASDRPRARRLATASHIYATLAGTAVAIVLLVAASSLLAAIGATGRTHALALRYVNIQIPSMVLLMVGFAASAVLRSVGDARRAMTVTLVGAAFNLVLDPLLIFGFGLGIDGAAWASVASRAAFLTTGLWGVIAVHRLLDRPTVAAFVLAAPLITQAAIPAVLTNIATPVANAYITKVIALFGDSAVAGYAIMGRISAVAFGAVFALSGSIGPIIGQNLGAKSYGRVAQAVGDALRVNVGFTLAAWAILAVLAPYLVQAFGATGEAEKLVMLFCRWLAPLFGFLGALFIANAVFNALGAPQYATAFNWGRATFGTVPFVLLGGKLGGSAGVLIGQFVGGIVTGIWAVIVVRRMIRQLGTPPP